MSPLPSALALGAPGLYQAPDTPIHALTGVRMDVCAFVGVAPRGPARAPVFSQPWAPRPYGVDPSPFAGGVQLAVPVPVESWSAYERLFGGLDTQSLLPYAVASFFENGGRRAYVVRIVHQYFEADGTTPDAPRNAEGVAHLEFLGLPTTAGTNVHVRARNEGTWGNRLRAELAFATRSLALSPGDMFVDRIRLPKAVAIETGSTLRILMAAAARSIRHVSMVVEDWNPADGTRQRWAFFDAPVATVPVSMEIVEGTLTVDDGVGTSERHEHLGLSSTHSRWLAAVLVQNSELLYPCAAPGNPASDWLDADLQIDEHLAAQRATLSAASALQGTDRAADIVPEDFFDPDWVLGNEYPGCGIHSLVDLEDLSLLVVPDLYAPGVNPPLESIVAVPFAGPEFAECVTIQVPAQGPAASALTGLQLDPTLDLDAIAALQRRVVELADQLESFIVLLDVPPGLSHRRTLYWRAKFDSAYAAAYHPWPRIPHVANGRATTRLVNPSAVAAGIIAQREGQFGVPFGPANVIAAGVVAVDDVISRSRHDELHQNAINVYLPERDGIRLTAARTLSLDSSWRQLTVRRLITMIRRTLDRQMQWAVFEPNGKPLRAQISRALEAFLRQLHRANAFTGATENEAFFVKCDDVLNSRQVEQDGRLIAQVGVAPAEPLEFIVLDIAREGDALVIAEAS